jgi:prepilin-type N-terminal cleavage/methylation domain-containing protein
MRSLNDHRGTSLIELLIAMAIFSLIISVIFSLYATMLKTSSSTRKIAKVVAEISNTVWPFFKEIESAGFGVTANSFGGSCAPEISSSGATNSQSLTIYSTATGPQTPAPQTATGTWSFIGPQCQLCAGAGCPGGVFNTGNNVSIISPSDKSNLGTTTVAAGGTLTGCLPNWPGNIAYLVPSLTSACFDTSYTLSQTGTKTKTCAAGTQQLSRSSVAANTTAPMLDCVLAVNYIFGCIDTSGNVTWQPSNTNTCPLLNSNGNYNPRIIRIGLVVQDSNQNEYAGPQPQPNITLFGDTPAATRVTVSLTTNPTLGTYRWRTIERSISLRNLE